MIIQIWNIRGIGNPQSQQLANFYKKSLKLDLLVLLEPLVDFNSPKYCRLLGFDAIHHNVNNKIWICSTSAIKIHVLEDEEHYLHCSISLSDGSSPFLATFVYAKCTRRERYSLWEEVSALGASIQTPWCVGGDFNIITSPSEREGGSSPNLNAIADFNDFICVNGLLDFGFSGVPFTWEQSTGTKQRLDRVLFNNSWSDSFTQTTISHGMLQHSDHRPLLLKFLNSFEKPKSSFKFLNMWTLHPDFLKEIEANWNMPARTSGLRKLKEKLFRLKQFLQFWNKKVFGNVFERIKKLEAEVLSAELAASVNPCLSTSEVLKSKKILFDLALDQEEEFWKQKASSNWCVKGERNTLLFHNMAKRKRARLNIHSITFQDATLIEPNLLKQSAVEYFTNHFAGDLPILVQPTLILPGQEVTLEQNAELCKLPTMEELHIVVKGLKADSAPGPDGFTGKFFQVAWDIIKSDLLEAVLDFFLDGQLPLGFSHTLLALIPKKDSPQEWCDFRPISLCSNVQKIISKLLNDRLALLLPNLISLNQSGFVKDRAIVDNILLVQELAHAVDNKNKGANVIVKLDMMKAYDRVQWSFLKVMLQSFGFAPSWVNLVMKVVTNCHYSVLINGETCGFIHAMQGLRQGDPISPALFILMNEYLSRSLNDLFAQHPCMYYKVPKGIPITHLAYADDCVIFCNGSSTSIALLKDFIGLYESHSGQKVNLSKSGCLIGKRVDHSPILSALNMPAMTFPFSYLGVPITKGNKKKSWYMSLLSKIRAKFLGWNLEYISQGGRLTLIKSVLNALPVYLLQVLKPPNSVIYEIEQIFSKFFWGSIQGPRKMHWTKWQNLCYPLIESGLNVCSLYDMSTAFTIKLWFKLRKNTSLWATFMHAKYVRPTFPGNLSPKCSDSPMWKRLLKICPIAQEHMFWQTGTGNVFFWHDHWFPNLSVVDFQSSLIAGSVDDSIIQSWFDGDSWDLAKLDDLPVHIRFAIGQNIPCSSYRQAALVWKLTQDGTFSTSSARNLVRKIKPETPLFEHIWSPYIAPTVSIFWWKILHGWLPVDTVIQRKGIVLASKCQCCRSVESLEHVLLHSPVVHKAWLWFSNMLLVPCLPQHSLSQRLVAWRSSSDKVKKGHIRGLIPLLIAWFAWKARNESKHRNKKISSHSIIVLTLRQLHLIHSSFKIPDKVWKGDASLAHMLGLQIHRVALKPLLLVYWHKPPVNWMKVNTNAAVHSLSSRAAVAGVLRCSNGRVINISQKFLGRRNSFEAELEAIHSGILICRQMGYTKIIVESDALSVIQMLNSARPLTHWRLLITYQHILSLKLELDIIFQHIHREGNSVVDLLAKEALALNLTREINLGACSSHLKKLVYSDNSGVPYLRIPK